MGIVEHKLAEFNLGDDHYVIEYNVGDTIHIHINKMRLEMSVEEFNDLFQVISEARLKVMNKKNLIKTE